MTESAIANMTISGSRITRTDSGNFTNDGFIVGDLIRIIGSSSNTGTYTVSAVGTTTMDVTQTLITESVAFSAAVVNYVLFNTSSIASTSHVPQTTGMSYHVFLDFGARSDDDLGTQSPITNRIGLLAESFNVATTKSRPTFAIPGTALVTGESKTLSIDLAAATKTFTMTGIITEQLMVRKYPTGGRLDENNPLAASGEYPGKDGSEVSRVFTAQEIAQLLHSALDSSFLQPYQNITNMAVLIPSYHTGVDENTSVEFLPLIPFSFKARYQDNLRAITLDNTQFFTPSHSSSIVSHPVVIQSVTTDFVPGQPWLTFSINGEFIFDVMGSVKDVFGEDS